MLRRHPEAGPRIKGSGGLRKLRWGIEGEGKSGGVRIIYYWVVTSDRIFMVYMYPKEQTGRPLFRTGQGTQNTVEKEL